MRYPGSKAKHVKFLLPLIPDDVRSFSEPFAGTAAVTLAVAARQYLDRIIINDLDYGMSAYWWAVVNDHETLVQRILDYKPKAAHFYSVKRRPNTGDRSKDGFRHLVLHSISYSGLGHKAGSPIGGREQTGKYLVDCRWNANRRAKEVLDAHKILSRSDVMVLNGDWSAAMGAEFVYLDPPYYKEGGALYQHGGLDHERLAAWLWHQPSGWLLSYDNEPEVRALYGWASVEPVDVRSHLHHRAIKDVIIHPKDIS